MMVLDIKKLKEKRKNIPIKLRFSLEKLEDLEKRVKKRYSKRKRGITLNKRNLYFAFKTLKELPKHLTYEYKYIFCCGVVYLTLNRKLILNYYKKYLNIVDVTKNSIIVECPQNYEKHPYLHPAIICGVLGGGGNITYKCGKRCLEVDLETHTNVKYVLKELGIA